MAPSKHFPLPLSGQFEDNGRRLILTTPLIYLDQEKNLYIEVPAGFKTDFNSVPRGLWNVFPPWQYPEAGVVHDWLYKAPGSFSRGDCDDIHRRILDILGCSWIKRQGAWLVLRSAGWKPWNSYRSKDVK